MRPVVFFDAETERCFLIRSRSAIRRFCRVRPHGWACWEASDAEIRRLH